MVNGVFLLGAGVLAAVATGIVLWPLARDGKRTLWLSSVAAMVLATVGLYQLLGTPAALHLQESAAPKTLEEGIALLQASLKEDPSRTDGWVLLARSQVELERFSDAATSYARAVQLSPDEPPLLVEAAQARAQAAPEHIFDDTAVHWLEHARELAPDNERAGWLLGIVQRQRGNAEQAAQIWEALLPRLDPSAAAALQQQINEARGIASNAPASAPAAPTQPAAATSNGGITVKVALAPEFAAKVRLKPDTTVFVIARIPGGPPMPVAVERHVVQDLPLIVTLDDADSPMPTQKLSALKEVEVFARLSSSGNAMRQADDIDSAPVRVTLPAAAPIALTLGDADKP